MDNRPNQNPPADYWTSHNPNAMNEYDDGLNPVWISKPPVFAKYKNATIYKNKNHNINGWTIPDAVNWA